MHTEVLILGGGLQALSVAYSLWKMNNAPVCIAPSDDEIRHSRFVKHFYPKQDDVFNQILSVINEQQIKLIIPMSDGFAELLSRHKQTLENDYHCYVPTPSHDIFTLGADKAKLMAFCEQHGFPHPRTRLLNASSLSQAAQYVQFPALIKPNRSVGARGIKIVHSLDELEKEFPRIESLYGSATMQEYIETNGLPYYNVMLYRSAEGKITGSAIIEILRFFPIQGGSSSLCRTIEQPELLSVCSRILEQLQWVGMADFDVLKTTNGEFKIIEINPRVPASLRAADIAGVNFPDIMLSDARRSQTPSYSYRTNMYLRYFGLDLMWFTKSPERFTAKPNWFTSIGRKTFFQDIYAADPSTWFSWLINGFIRFLQKRKHIQ